VSRPRTIALLSCVLLAGVASRTERQGSTRYGVGRPATPAEIAAWNIDVNPFGEGLPAGQGTAVEGARVFAAKCSGCHGVRGEGLPVAPALVGREPREGFPFGQSAQHVKTVGNYWPYATTLYDYINRAMPSTAPGSLEPNEIYAVVAWILSENEIITASTVLDAASLPRVRMPARDRFVPDDRRPGATFR
jgi:S-disulfanyl-L-cysteine oxidoreductase SoxD